MAVQETSDMLRIDQQPTLLSLLFMPKPGSRRTKLLEQQIERLHTDAAAATASNAELLCRLQAVIEERDELIKLNDQLVTDRDWLRYACGISGPEPKPDSAEST